MSDERNERFEQPAEFIEIVERSSRGVPIEGLALARERIAAGEDRDKVLTDFAMEMVERQEQRSVSTRVLQFNPDQPRDEHGRWEGGIDPRVKEDLTNILQEAKANGYVAAVHVVGSWANMDPARLPDRHGVGTSDIDIMLEPKPDSSWRNSNRQRVWELASKLETTGSRSGRKVHVNVEPVLGGAKSLTFRIAEFNPDQPRDDHGRWVSDDDDVAADKETEILLSKDHIAWEDSLLGDEKEAIENYVGPEGRSEYINRHLRGVDEAWRASDRLKQEVAALDSALARATTNKEITVYRGISSDSLVGKLKPGVEFTDAGFVSSSLDPTHAKTYFTAMVNPTYLEIRTNKGAYISGIAGAVDIDGEKVNEYEWLIPRNTRFRVDAVEEEDNFTRVIVRTV